MELTDAITTDSYWVIPTHDGFPDLCVERWSTIPDRINPRAMEIPGLPPRDEIVAEVLRAMEASGGTSSV